MKPDWLKVRLPTGDVYRRVRGILDSFGLSTVCQEALCPNLGECWGSGTATIMLLGEVCTRGCRFCGVKTGNPRGSLDGSEPDRVAGAVAELGLGYVVLTSVDRDDLPDGGASHFARAVRAIKGQGSAVKVEVLMPDFYGDKGALEEVVGSGADVLAHNLETVERLTPRVRDRRCSYRLSLQVLKTVKELNGSSHTKSSLLLGLGEEEAEVVKSMQDLRAAGVDVLTLGQYLQPTRKHLPVAQYVPPRQFDHYREMGLAMGFRAVLSGPLVRSSYKAEETFLSLTGNS